MGRHLVRRRTVSKPGTRSGSSSTPCVLIPTGAILRADATIPSHAHVRSAVRQWPGNVADLDFACVIREAPVFLLVAMHLPEVEALSQEDADPSRGDRGRAR